ncbi:unnamed protein product [Closterium sp. Naga37s-1]|nr:unnamed protein product [Closterium sp. Naga37s-1]
MAASCIIALLLTGSCHYRGSAGAAAVVTTPRTPSPKVPPTLPARRTPGGRNGAAGGTATWQQPRDSLQPELTLLANNSYGARCLDGSPPGYYFRPGSGEGADAWHVHLPMGGWCFNRSALIALRPFRLPFPPAHGGMVLQPQCADRALPLPYVMHSALAIPHALCPCHTSCALPLPYLMRSALAIPHALCPCHTSCALPLPYLIRSALAVPHTLCPCRTSYALPLPYLMRSVASSLLSMRPSILPSILPSVLSSYLANNRLSGSLPSAISRLEKLQQIWLDNNSIEGPLPSAICSLPWLWRM